jgi:hypothetical protein
MSTGLDRDGFHELLWQRRAPNGSLRITQTRLAREFHVNKFTMSRILKSMSEEGRLRPISTGGGSPNTYEVVDPVEWSKEGR